MKACYDRKPSALEAVGNGSWLYRFNIEGKVSAAIAEGTENPAEDIMQWECEEVTVWEPLTANKITEAVIASICPASHEQKLVNEYNAASLGLLGGSETSEEAKAKTAAYREFLERRALLKEMVDADCVRLEIN